MRVQLWKMRTGAYKCLYEHSLYSGYYEGLLKSFSGYPNPHFYQIELDLRRTFADEGNGYF